MSGDQRIEKYLSEAQPHSQGEFTWDVLRMGELMSVYAELDPHSYVLHCLAAAVLGGASFFHLCARGTSNTLRWDGRPVDSTDLEQLGPQGDSRQTALALALHTAARLGRVRLAVAGGCLEYHPRKGWSRLPARGEGNLLQVTLSQWWLAFAPSPALARLRSGGRYAPLALNVRLPGPKLCRWAVRWGELPQLPCRPEEWVSLAPSDWGCGCVFPGEGRWTLVVDGIGYTVPEAWPQLDVVWWGSFPLDLERADLVQGEELRAWKVWLALQLCPITGQRRWSGVPLELLLEHGGDEVWAAPWYQRANGRAASLDDLQAYYYRWGFLPVVGIPGPQEAFLFPEGFPRELQERYPNWAYLPERSVRLPQSEEYLVKVPLASGGEVGLRANPGFGQRVWSERGWQMLDRKPHGLDFSVESPRDYAGVLALVYTCLLEMECPSPGAGTFHTLAFVDYLIFARQMRVLSDPIERPHPNGSYGSLPITALLDKYPVQMLSGEKRSLTEVAEHWVAYLDPNSSQGFVCDYLVVELLRALQPRAANPVLRTRRCHLMLEGGQGSLLERLRGDPECAAYRALQTLPDLRLADEVEFGEAGKELGQGSAFLSTLHLLLAMTQGADRRRLLAILSDGLEVERSRDLEDMEPLCTHDLRLVWLWAKVESLLRVQHWAAAEDFVQEANQKFPGHWQTAYLSALVTGFRGDYDGAYRSLERALERGGPPSILQPYSWSCALLTRRPLTQLLLVERPLTLRSRVLAASKIADVSARVEACVQLLRLPECPASVHEVLGDALAEAGERQAASQSWRLFLAARHDQLMEFDLAQRQARVRQRLEG